MTKDVQFDPNKLMDCMASPLGVERQLEKSIADKRSLGAIGSNAFSMVSDATKCIVAGLFDDARRLLTKAEEWLSTAIAEQEKPQHNYGEFATEATRFQNLYLCRWLLDGSCNEALARRAVEDWERWLNLNPNDKDNLTLLLPFYIDAGAFQEAIVRFNSVRQLKPPANAKEAKRQPQVCYVLAKRRLGEEYQDVNEGDLLEQFCRCNVASYLDQSRFNDVAQWMKIAHWQPGDDPFATVLRCYDYLQYEPPRYPT